MIYVQKLVKNRNQYLVTIPKKLVSLTGLDNCRVLMLYTKDNKTVTIEEYDAKRARKSGL